MLVSLTAAKFKALTPRVCVCVCVCVCVWLRLILRCENLYFLDFVWQLLPACIIMHKVTHVQNFECYV